MPVITVYGFPNNAPNLEELPNKLISAVTSVRGLRLSTKQVSVFFPANLVQKGLGENLIAIVEYLLVKPERTQRVLYELATAMTAILSEYADSNLPQCNRIETIFRSVHISKDNIFDLVFRRNSGEQTP